MSSPSKLGSPQPQHFNFQEVAETFIRSTELPNIELSQELVNELANLVLLSGKATPQHFKNLKGVTAIRAEAMKTPIPTLVLATIFKQYQNSLEVCKISFVESAEEQRIPQSLPCLKVISIQPYLSSSTKAEQVNIQTPNTAERPRTREERAATLPEKESKPAKFVRISTLEELDSLVVDANSRIALDLSKCQDINNETLQTISTKFGSQIVTLDVSDLGHVHLQGCHFPNLQELTANGSGITDEALRQIAASSPGLKELFIEECKNVTLAGCDFQNLLVLWANSSGITDEALRQIAKTSQGLQKLYVRNCPQVTLTGCHFTNLETLYMRNSGITLTTCREIAKTSRRLSDIQ